MKTKKIEKRHEVLVGNIGTVYSGTLEIDALLAYRSYVQQSRLYQGRAANETVTWLVDGEFHKEFDPAALTPRAEVNSSHGTFTIHAKTGDILYLVLEEPDSEDAATMRSILRFDLDEYFRTYPKEKRGETLCFDIMDLGYTYTKADGTLGQVECYEPPLQDWRDDGADKSNYHKQNEHSN